MSMAAMRILNTVKDSWIAIECARELALIPWNSSLRDGRRVRKGGRYASWRLRNCSTLCRLPHDAMLHHRRLCALVRS